MTTNNETSEGIQIIVMGVSGSGKSTIGALIAGALGVPFVDGDSLHPQSNIEKMAGGQPLNDDDRWPWLATVGRTLADAGRRGTGMVIACSALRRSYREAILETAPRTRFVHLAGTREVLATRVEGRSDHFMPTTLLDSQFATLEPLGDDEPGIVINIDQTVPAIVAEAAAALTESSSA
ncbi:gluconokinase [Mycetocola manganoxydans]|uniref:Gluconokinase n=1 Tax=Mycetocola manganoxydans TaxID=699879 RepID=A0A3L6ZNE5_9MICO|nr:gluconokinase [Mycetocola manganoxydans]RLP69419.1 gluconokinase [Mycetocola manganoxydans]GHD50634.1 gluconokinase [Mycetocola manganoxydans]